MRINDGREHSVNLDFKAAGLVELAVDGVVQGRINTHKKHITLQGPFPLTVGAGGDRGKHYPFFFKGEISQLKIRRY